jgi:hypothetical protein
VKLDERDALKKWADNWRSTGPELERLRKAELRGLAAAAHRQAIGDLLALGYRFRRTTTTSGLVDQQRYFSKLRV